MCYPVQCPNCRKTTWEGCGDHVDEVMSAVPVSERCTCRPAADAAQYRSN